MVGCFERSDGGVVVYELGQTYPRRGKAGKIGSTFGRYIATFKMIEKECFVKVVFIGRNFDIGRCGGSGGRCGRKGKVYCDI